MKIAVRITYDNRREAEITGCPVCSTERQVWIEAPDPPPGMLLATVGLGGVDEPDQFDPIGCHTEAVDPLSELVLLFTCKLCRCLTDDVRSGLKHPHATIAKRLAVAFLRDQTDMTHREIATSVGAVSISHTIRMAKIGSDKPLPIGITHGRSDLRTFRDALNRIKQEFIGIT